MKFIEIGNIPNFYDFHLFMLGGRYIVADNKNVETKQYTRIKCRHLQTQIAEIRGYDKHQDIHLLLCKSFN